MTTRKSQQTAAPEAEKEIAKAVAETVGTSSQAVDASSEASLATMQEAAGTAAGTEDKVADASADAAQQLQAASEKPAEKAVETAVETAAEGTSGTRGAAEAGQAEVASTAADVQDNMPLVHQQTIDAVGATSRSVMEGVSQMQREIATFVSSRIRHDMSIQQELMQCRSFDEVRAVQARFFQTAIDQYSAEATKLMRMGQDMVQRTVRRNTQ